jgi:hypothetical protein
MMADNEGSPVYEPDEAALSVFPLPFFLSFFSSSFNLCNTPS